MLNFLARRIVQLIPTLFFVSILIFSLQHLLPGDPALVMAGEEHDPAVIAERVVTMVTTGEVTAVDGSQLAVSVESVCVHGDSPGAVQIATAVRDRLKATGTDIEAFASKSRISPSRPMLKSAPV